MADQIIVLITAGSGEEAAKIANTLVNEKLAACVNIASGIRSVFFWEGKTQEAGEILLICKSTQTRLGQLIKRVKEIHSYSVPEIIALPIIGGSGDYLDWVTDSTKE